MELHIDPLSLLMDEPSGHDARPASRAACVPRLVDLYMEGQ